MPHVKGTASPIPNNDATLRLIGTKGTGGATRHHDAELRRGDPRDRRDSSAFYRVSRGFHVTYTEVTDRSIEPLVRRYQDLRYLYLNGTEISNQTLRAAAKLENLKAVKVAKTNVTDDRLRTVAELTVSQRSTSPSADHRC